jgi:hypothetical protein
MMKKLMMLMLLFTTISVGTFGQVVMDVQTEEVATKSLEESLEFVVAKAIEIAETTGEFVIEQAPLLLQEFYAWAIMSAIFNMIWLPLAILLIYGFRKSCPVDERHGYGLSFYGKIINEGFAIPGHIFGSLGIITGAIFFFVSVYKLMFILVAPKLYLIEHFIK